MKCLNPACGSVEAIELNISLNLYGGDQYTDYGDPGALIATSCTDCETITYVADWLEIVLGQVRPTNDDMVLTHSQTREIVWDEYLNASPETILDPTVPRCDVCTATEEQAKAWCGNCGCCMEHCQNHVGCPIVEPVVYGQCLARSWDGTGIGGAFCTLPIGHEGGHRG
jgi:hypothetical protein